MENIPRIFIMYEADRDVKIYKLNMIDENKCILILDKYSDICSNSEEEVLSFADGMINIFFGNDEKYYKDLIQKHITIDLSNQIGCLEEMNRNKVNSIYPARIYYVNFSDC